jgi:hypothetical protein
MLNDIINASFEVIGSLACWANVFKILKDKEVKGVYWPFTFFFTLWGIWNLYYYASLNQWWSVGGAAVMCTGNAAWVWLAFKFTKKERQDKKASIIRRNRMELEKKHPITYQSAATCSIEELHHHAPEIKGS